MKIQLLATSTAILLLSGCSQEAATPPKDTSTQASISKAIDAAQKSKQATETNAQQKMDEGNGLISQGVKSTTSDTSNTNEKTMEFVSQYDGAILHTSMGDITVKFYNDASPRTVDNFLKLASEKFYDGTRFHRVIKDFMIQGGDPNSKDKDWSNDGTGGPGYAFADEFNNNPLIKGSLAMANSGPNTNGSQFFIVTAASTPWLNGKHTNFGEVTSGMDIVTAIESAKVNANDHPLEDITVKSIDLIKKK